VQIVKCNGVLHKAVSATQSDHVQFFKANLLYKFPPTFVVVCCL